MRLAPKQWGWVKTLIPEHQSSWQMDVLFCKLIPQNPDGVDRSPFNIPEDPKSQRHFEVNDDQRCVSLSISGSGKAKLNMMAPRVREEM